MRKEEARYAPPNNSWHLVRFSSHPIAAELVQATLILKRHAQDGDTSPLLFNPLHLNKITLHSGGSVVGGHFERKVLATLERFRET